MFIPIYKERKGHLLEGVWVGLGWFGLVMALHISGQRRGKREIYEQAYKVVEREVGGDGGVLN